MKLRYYHIDEALRAFRASGSTGSFSAFWRSQFAFKKTTNGHEFYLQKVNNR